MRKFITYFCIVLLALYSGTALASIGISVSPTSYIHLKHNLIINLSWNIARDMHVMRKLSSSLNSTQGNTTNLDDDDPVEQDINIPGSDHMNSNFASFILPNDLSEIPSWPAICLYTVQIPP